jgi:hypothetical protein
MVLIQILTNTIIEGVIGSLIAGFLTIGIIEGYKFYKLNIQHKQFKKVFGTYDKDKLHLIFPALSVRPEVIHQLQTSDLLDNKYPLVQYGGAFIKSSKLLAYADTISLKYVLDILATTLGSKSVITTDEDLQRKLDLSLISFGGSSFYCTYVLDQPNNKFYKFNGDSVISTQDPSRAFTINAKYDYGLIIKYQHDNFPYRTWIIVAGLGESGTRGAGWFLSTHWQQLSEAFNNNTFGLVVRVNHGVDNSAIEVDRTT